ncbi:MULTISPECIES: hypothetical protein [unclassified Cryobacterium]|uniref:hypothetical protein n=1 Tax=unclassified Cryobacterium TaxID=2649013 RepID=UPI002AB58D16|nr:MULTISPECIES: hypothetical protein [unclassified Cryobacterium]MDY7542583.1 hypothetical protein [Cryobacterium sp. 5B3]MEB0264703.1 hypothetical protein [Cryobacterium sp. 10I5]MEB0273675.1 hypothetical protein [Cryobacterium sp. 5B3]
MIEAAAEGIGITDRAGLTAYLGLDISQPVSMLMIAAILTRLPVELGATFRIVDSDSLRP